MKYVALAHFCAQELLIVPSYKYNLDILVVIHVSFFVYIPIISRSVSIIDTVIAVARAQATCAKN